MKNSKVHLSGEVIEIDYEKRDVKIKPINDSIITVHMWTTLSDDTGFWRSEDEWRDYVEVGSYITLNGYLGNNGRIITNPGNVWVNDQLLSHNTVEVTGILRDDAVIETSTPGRRRVLFKTDNNGLENCGVNNSVSALGVLIADTLAITFAAENRNGR